MSHELELWSYRSYMMYELLEGYYQTVPNNGPIPPPTFSGLRVDLNSIVLNPLDNGNYEVTYRMFANSKDPDETQAGIAYLDKLVYQINKYTDSPGTTTGIEIVEKAEPETEARAAILTSASFQPVWESSVGSLMIRDGWVGLLRFERGPWEAITTTDYPVWDVTVDLADPVQDGLVTQEFIDIEGSLDSRIRSIVFSYTDVLIRKIVVGIRPQNKDISNYQPVVNMGAGLRDALGDPIGPGGPTDDYEMILWVDASLGTWPAGQTTPTYVGYLHNTYYAQSYTHYIRLDEISTSDQDDFNDDYVGDYEIYVKYEILGLAYSAANTYYKFTLGYSGSGDTYAYNDPVYQTNTPTEDLERQTLFSLGRVSIPAGAFATGLGNNYLKNFTFSLTTEIISTAPAIEEHIRIDSMFLMPVRNISLTNTNYVAALAGSFTADVTYAENPLGSSGYLLSQPYNNLELTGNVVAEPGKVSFIMLQDAFGIGATATTQLRTFPRYNIIKDKG